MRAGYQNKPDAMRDKADKLMKYQRKAQGCNGGKKPAVKSKNK